MHDDGHPSGHGNDSLAQTASLGDVRRPSFSQDHPFTRVSMTCAASYSNVRIIRSPQRETRPTRLLSPDSLSTGVNPKAAPTAFELTEAGRDIDGADERQSKDRPDTRNRHQAPAVVIIPNDLKHFPMKPG